MRLALAALAAVLVLAAPAAAQAPLDGPDSTSLNKVLVIGVDGTRWDLLEAALSRSETVNPGDVRKNTGSMKVLNYPAIPPTAFLIDYRDGTRGTILLLNGHHLDFVFAAKVKGEVTTSSPGRRSRNVVAPVFIAMSFVTTSGWRCRLRMTRRPKP